MGLFLKLRGLDFEILSNMCNTVDLGHQCPMDVKGLKYFLSSNFATVILVKYAQREALTASMPTVFRRRFGRRTTIDL